MPVAEQRRRLARQHHANTQTFDAPFQILTARRIELPFHQRVGQVNHGYVAAANLQSARRFETQQTASDDHGLKTFARLREKRVCVVERSEYMDVALVHAGDRRNECAAASRENELVVRSADPLLIDNRAGLAVDMRDLHAQARVDVVRPVPFRHRSG